jgi:integrase
MSDNGSAMVAAETTQGLVRLGIVHETTLPFSPEQNGKQERFWGQIEGRRAYLYDFEDLRAHLGEETITRAVDRLLSGSAESAREIVETYRAVMRAQKGKVGLYKARNLSAATANRRLSAIESLVKQARGWGMIEWQLYIQKEKRSPVRDSRPACLDDIVRLFEHLEQLRHSESVLRDRAILRLLFDTALNRGVIAGLDCTDYFAEFGKLRVRQRGTNSYVRTNLSAETAAAIKAWLKVHDTRRGAMFINFDQVHRTKRGLRLSESGIYKMVRLRAKEAGCKGAIRPHGIRHAGVMVAMDIAHQRGFSLRQVAEFSGYKQISALRRQVSLNQRAAEDLPNAIAAKVGRSAKRSAS